MLLPRWMQKIKETLRMHIDASAQECGRLAQHQRHPQLQQKQNCMDPANKPSFYFVRSFPSLPPPQKKTPGRLLCEKNSIASPQIDLDAIKDSPSCLRMIERECRTMMSLSHPNIVRLQEVYRPRSGDRLYMVLDRLEGGSVDGLWRKQGRLSEDHAAHIILQVASAVRYCHDRGIAVRVGLV